MAGFVCFEAVYLLSSDQIAKEMRFSEFEAILDRYVSLPELGGQSVRGVYVAADEQLTPLSGVLFTLSFDNKGFADPKWHLNLPAVARKASAKLAGLPLAERQSYRGDQRDASLLWLASSAYEAAIQAILARLKENRLSFNVKVSQRAAEPQVDVAALKSHTENVEQYYQQHISEKDEQIARLNQQLKESQEEAAAYARRAAKSQARLIDLESSLETLTERYEGMLAEQSEKLQALQAKNDDGLIADLKRQNNRLAIDREYFDGMRAKLERQLIAQNEQLQKARADSSDGLIQRLQTATVEIVAYQPGSGHTTIAPNQLLAYLDDPHAWAAKHCGVSKNHYLAWLDHFDRPVCRECQQLTARINSPVDFDAQRDTLCVLHRQAM